MASAVRAGPRVDATFSVATGPKSHVTGASGMPMASTLVLDRRLIPPGWKSAVEWKRLDPWAIACAGHSRNQRKSAGSPQPQMVTDVGCVDHACHHSTIDKAR